MKTLDIPDGRDEPFHLIEDEFYRYENGKIIFTNNTGSYVRDWMRCTRNVGKYKIYATHFNCALPQTRYEIVDTEDGTLYKFPTSDGFSRSILNDLVIGLKIMQGIIPPPPEPVVPDFDPLDF